jgi:chitinase
MQGPAGAASTAMSRKPRIIYYHQTHYHNNAFVSILPVLQNKTGVTHVNIAAIHVNSPPGNIALNDDPYNAEKYIPLWDEVATLQAAGVKVLGMLGGAAQGSFSRLDGTAARFEEYYLPLKAMISWTGLDGLDLDVEEAMSLGGVVRLIDRLKFDFGHEFLITLAPVATAMMNLQNLSGFNHEDLEKGLGARIAWYNVQFYCDWGDMAKTEDFDAIMRRGWPEEKVVIGLVTNPANGAGWISDSDLRKCLEKLLKEYPNLGGVMGWEYFNSVTSAHPETGQPWTWAMLMQDILNGSL